MTESEAKQWLKHTRAYQHKCDNCEYIDLKGACNEECKDFYDVAIQSLEMQDKLKQWIEGYKRQEFADMTLTRDGLIDILEEFRLECEKPMKEVTVVMNLQVTRIIKNPIEESIEISAENTKSYAVGLLKAHYDDVVVNDVQVFEGE